MADVCELAHELTVRECTQKGITVDAEKENEVTEYTEEAQKVFDEIYDIISEVLDA